MPSVDKKGLARRVRARRVALGIGQSALAEATGMSQQGVDNIEHAKVGRPRQLLELAEALQTTPDWLLHERGPEVVSRVNPFDEMVELARRVDPGKLGLVIRLLKTLREDPNSGVA